MEKCSALWRKVQRPKSSEIIVSVLGRQLQKPVPTRWNSMYDSIKVLLSKKTMLSTLCQKLEVPRFSEADLEHLEKYMSLLQPIAEGIDFLQGENGIFFGFLIPTLATIKTKYLKILSKDFNNDFAELGWELIKALEKRFEKFFNLDTEAMDAVVAAVLCPSVKLKWVEALNSKFGQLKKEEILNYVINAVKDFSSTENDSNVLQTKTKDQQYFVFSVEGKLFKCIGFHNSNYFDKFICREH